MDCKRVLSTLNWRSSLLPVQRSSSEVWQPTSCFIRYGYSSELLLPHTAPPAAKNKEGRPEVLDHRKAYNIGQSSTIPYHCQILSDISNSGVCSSLAILLGHLKLPVEVIKRAVLACDMTTFSEQHLQQLETFAPDSKEVYTLYLTQRGLRLTPSICVL